MDILDIDTDSQAIKNLYPLFRSKFAEILEVNTSDVDDNLIQVQQLKNYHHSKFKVLPFTIGKPITERHNNQGS